MQKAKVLKLTKMLADKQTKKTHDRLRVISGRSRFRILLLLNEEKKGMNVTDIAEILGASMSRVSHQMRILKRHGLVSVLPQGREMIYRTGVRV